MSSRFKYPDIVPIKAFAATRDATAIADRLVENAEIFLLGGDTLRKAGKSPNPPSE